MFHVKHGIGYFSPCFYLTKFEKYDIVFLAVKYYFKEETKNGN